MHYVSRMLAQLGQQHRPGEYTLRSNELPLLPTMPVVDLYGFVVNKPMPLFYELAPCPFYELATRA